MQRFFASPSSAARRAFTLTELLVVIAIIAMLVALTSAGVMTAMGKARATRIKSELDQIDMALKSYKEKYGAYPPSDLSFNQAGLSPTEKAARLAPIRQHIAMAFPRYDLTYLPNDLAAAGLDLENFRPDQALYFFLRGFGQNPIYPFVSLNNKQIEKGTESATVVKLVPLFEFDVTRLAAVSKTGADIALAAATDMPSYFPAGTTPGTTGAPYLYWDARSYGEKAPISTPLATNPGYYFNSTNTTKGSPGKAGLATNPLYPNAGTCVPYWLDANGDGTADLVNENWANPDSYQLIAAGVDRKYGTTAPLTAANERRLYPTGTNYDILTQTDDDNASNFTSKARIGDDKP